MSDTKSFLSLVKQYRGNNVFNPFGETCAETDCEEAAERRLCNLRAQLKIAQSDRVFDLWIGRDLGYLGGRRTGIALTDEYHLPEFRAVWGLDFDKVTRSATCQERTATVIWRALKALERPVLTWNVFPFHPHIANRAFTNRAHTAAERRVGLGLLTRLVRIVKPERIVAIGRNAQAAAREISHGAAVVDARHPSYGGQSDFLKVIQSTYRLENLDDQRTLFESRPRQL